MFLKSLFWEIVNSIIKIFLEVFIFDKKIRRILKGNWAKLYLKKYVNNKYKNCATLQSTQIGDEATTIIWQYWESKNETIPPLVKACLNSVDKYKGHCRRILLTPKNLKEYIELPDIIYKMKESGKMCTAHFVDIVRTALLVKYGGVWIDSTILLTNTIPDYITNSELFFYRTDEKQDLDGLCGTNYLISANSPNNRILKEVLNAMYLYWHENRFLINYFSHMHIITLVCKKHPDLLNQIPFYSFYPVQQLQWELLSKFDEARWKQLKSNTSVHKLTHKTKVITKNKNFDISGTFYEHIIEEYK